MKNFESKKQIAEVEIRGCFSEQADGCFKSHPHGGEVLATMLIPFDGEPETCLYCPNAVCDNKIIYVQNYLEYQRNINSEITVPEFLEQMNELHYMVTSVWDEVHITTVFPPEKLYDEMNVKDRAIDDVGQLLRRIDFIVYHFKDNGEYKKIEIPMSEYIDYDDMLMKIKLGRYDKNILTCILSEDKQNVIYQKSIESIVAELPKPEGMLF